MLKKLLTVLAMLFYAATSFAAVEVNSASAADLDGIKGIGPSLSGKIIKERKKGEFKDWGDLISRVKGMGSKSSARFSAEGLTVNGKRFSAAAQAKADKKKKEAEAKASKTAAKGEDTPASKKKDKAAEPAAAAAPQATASDAKK